MTLRAGHILALAFPLFFAAPSGAADFAPALMTLT